MISRRALSFVFLLVPLVMAFTAPTSTAGAGPATVNINIPGPFPSSSPQGIIGNLYEFALMLSGLLAFGAIVYGGVRYALAAGNPGGQSDARDQITQALIGLFLLVGAFLILNTINPALTQGLGLPTLPQIQVPTSTRAYPGTCTPLQSGDASITNLQRTCFDGNAVQASSIANGESGGDPFAESEVDKCRPENDSVSIGLFQINISANQVGGVNCPAAFDRPYTSANPSCKVVNRQLYDSCIRAAKNSSMNIEAACRISGNGSNWSAWGANRVCGF